MLAPNTLAHWLPTPQRLPHRSYRYTVRVLDIRKNTTRIEATRRDGTRVRRFVKLARRQPREHWQEA